MGNTLKVKRGTNLSNAGTPAAGELIYKTDTNELFVGDGSTAATGLSAIGGSGSGDIEGVTAGVGLSGGGSSGTVSLAVDLSELTDMTASVNSSEDELIILDNGADRRKLISEIPLSAFNNDSGFITTDTTLSTEQVQDIVGAMFTGNTETRGSLTYDDSDGTIDLVVDDMTANDNTFRTVTAGGNTLGATETLAFTAGSNITISESGGAVTIASTDTNTQLSTEQVQDIVGAMFSSNTETRISATYQDGDGTIDLVVDDMTANTVTTNIAGTGVSVSSGTGNSTISIGQAVGTSDTVAFGRVNLGSTNDSTFLSGNSLLSADGYIMVQGIVNESETGGTPAAITFGNGATLGNDQISLITSGNTRIHLNSSGVMTFNGTVAGTAIKDQDNMSSNSATHLATQQSIKAYVDAEVAGIVNSAPSALNTLDELAAALGDDANFATTTSDALGNRLRVDTASQGLTGTQQANAITNLGITATKAELNYVDGVTSNIQTQLNAKIEATLTNEQVQDIAGGMFSSNTETGIAATYQDGDGTIDLVVDYLPATDDRDVKPNAITTSGRKQVRAYFSSLGGLTGSANNNYQDLLVLSTYSDGTGGDVNALAFDKSEQKIRHYLADQSDTTWGTAKTIAYTDSTMTGTWNGSVIASAYLDSDTAHLSGSQTFSGAKTFTGRVTISDAGADGLHLNQDTSTNTNSNRLFFTGSSAASAIFQSGSVLSFRSGATAGSSSGTERMHIDTSGIDVTGNITVSGTVDGRDIATDGSKLDGIASGATANTGTVTAANGSNNRIATFSSSTAINGEGNLTFDGTNLTVAHSSGAVIFAAAHAADKIQLYSGGNEKIGTEANTMLFTADNYKFKDVAGTVNLSMDNAGNVSATADVIAFASSDKRLKDNLKPIENSLDKVSKLSGYEFDWNDKQKTYKGHDIGVVAQEVEEVLPELVATREDGYKAVKYEKIVALLIEPIKELKAEVEELKK